MKRYLFLLGLLFVVFFSSAQNYRGYNVEAFTMLQAHNKFVLDGDTTTSTTQQWTTEDDTILVTLDYLTSNFPTFQALSDSLALINIGGGIVYDVLAVSTTGGALLRLHGDDSSTDDVKLASGTGITVSYTDDNTITITNTSSGSSDLSFSVSSSPVTLYSSTGNDVTFTQGTGITLQGTSSSNMTITNSAPDQTVSIGNGTGINVTGTYPSFTVTNTSPNVTTDLTFSGTSSPYTLNSSDGTDVTFVQGTGISLSRNTNALTITNSSPDQTVSLTSGTGINVTGTYPNFTITNTVSADGNTTYDHLAVTTTGGALLRLHGSDSSNDDVKFANGTGITAAYTDANTITLTNTAPNVTTDLTFSGSASPYTLNSSDGTDVTFASGSGISLSRSTNQLTITNTGVITEVDGSISNEGILTVGAGTSTTSTLSTNTSGSGTVTISASTGLSISETTGTNGTITLTNSSPNVTTNLTFSGAASPYTLNSSDGTDVTFTQGTGISLSATSGNITITNSSPNVTTNLTISGTTSPLTLNSSDGTDVTITAGSGISLAGTSSNFTITNTGVITEVDGSTTNEAWTISDGTNTELISNQTVIYAVTGYGTGSYNATSNTYTINVTGDGTGSADLTFSGTSSPYTLNSSSGTDVTFAQGTGITLSRSTNELTITNSSPNVTTNLTWQVASNPLLYSSDGTDVTLTGGSGLTVTGTSSSNATVAHSNIITAGNFGDTGASRTLTYNGTFTVPYVTYDVNGHIVTKSNLTLTMPASSADGNTTYDHLAVTTTGGALLRLHGSDSSNDDVKFANGTGITAAYTDANTITITNTSPNVTTNLSFSGSSSPYTLNSSDGTDVTFTAGTGIGLSATSGNITISNTAGTVNYGTDGQIPVINTAGTAFEYKSDLYYNDLGSIILPSSAILDASSVGGGEFRIQYSSTDYASISWTNTSDIMSLGFYNNGVLDIYENGSLRNTYYGLGNKTGTATYLLGVDANGYFVETSPSSQLTQEQVQDYVGTMVTGNTETNITVTYDDANNQFDFVVTDAWYNSLSDLQGAVSNDFHNLGGTDANTTYSQSAVTTTGGAFLRLTGSDASTDDVKFASSGGTTVSYTDANTITISSPTISGSNTGDVSLSGSYDYITISGQTITRNQVDYTTDISNIPSTFAPSAHTLDSHSNVTITSNTSGEILKWNGSAWINNTLSEAGIQSTLTTGNLTENITGLQFDNTRQVIGGSATLSLTTGYVIPTTTEETNWNSAYSHVGNDGDLSATNEAWTISDGTTTELITDQTVIYTVTGYGTGSYNATSNTYTINVTGDGTGSTNLTFSGASSPYTLNSSSGSNVTFTQGTGISLSASTSNITITNSAPDQTVSIGNGTGINVTGSYPSFTVTNTSPNVSTNLTAQVASNPYLYSSDGSDVTFTGGTGISIAGTSSSNITITNSSPNVTTNLTFSGASSPYTLNSSDGSDVTFTAGTGIGLSASGTNLTITNNSPDQTVSFTNGTGISVTGSYPSFTVTNTAPTQWSARTGGIYYASEVSIGTSSDYGNYVLSVGGSAYVTDDLTVFGDIDASGISGSSIYSGLDVTASAYVYAGTYLQAGGGYIYSKELASASTPSSTYGVFYAKTDNLPYFKNDAGTEYPLYTAATTNYWTLSGSLLYPTSTSYNLLLGYTSEALSGARLQVSGNAYVSGRLFIGTTSTGYGWNGVDTNAPIRMTSGNFYTINAYESSGFKYIANAGAWYMSTGTAGWRVNAGGGGTAGSAISSTNYLDLNGSTGNLILGGSGYAQATNFVLNSDRRLKKDIRDLIDLDWVDSIQFKQFKMKEGDDHLRYGVIAQDLLDINPELVRGTEESMYSVAYTDLLIAKVARQDEQIKELKNEVFLIRGYLEKIESKLIEVIEQK